MSDNGDIIDFPKRKRGRSSKKSDGSTTFRASKNESRSADLPSDPGSLAERDRLRSKWAADLAAFSADRLEVVDRDHPGGAAVVPLVFSDSQIYIHNLIEGIARFNVERSTELHRQNRAIPISAYPIKTICLKARKVRWSTYFSARRFWKNEFTRGHTSLVMAHEREAARNIAGIEQRFHQGWTLKTGLPERTDIVRCSDDLLEWLHDSRTFVKTAGVKSGSAAGYTIHYLHFSEGGRYTDGEEVAVASTAAATYHENHVESTAHGLNWFKDEWDNAIWLEDAVKLWKSGEPMPRKWNGRFRAFWAWWQEKEYQLSLRDKERARIEATLDDVEREGIAAYGWSLEQIAWRRRMIAGPCAAQTELEPEEFFKQEYPSSPEEAFVAKGLGVFLRRPLEIMYKTSEIIAATADGGLKVKGLPHFRGRAIKDPSDPTGFRLVEAQSWGGSSLVLWTPPDPEAAYTQGVDTAEGLEQGDDSVTVIFDRTDGTVLKEAARLVGKFGPDELAELAYFVHKLYNDAYLVGERSGIGSATMIDLVKLGVVNMHHMRNVELFSDRESPESFTAGFDTKGKSKFEIIKLGQRMLREMRIILYHKEAISQWMSYQNVNGKYGAAPGKKDDCVIADCLAIFGHHEAPYERKKLVEKPADGLEGEALQNAWWKIRVKKLIETSRKRNEMEERLRKVRQASWDDVMN